jgi:hypothetical protein
MPESGTRGTSGGIPTAITGTIIDGITMKTAGTGAGGLKDMKLIVPSTSSTERSREHIGSIVTNIQIETIAANTPVLSPRDNSQDGRSLYDHPARTCPLSLLLVF